MSTTPLELRIFVNQQQQHAESFDAPLEIGRQMTGAEPLYQRSGPERNRLAVASLDQDKVPRQHVRLEPLAGGCVRVTNAGGKTVSLRDERNVVTKLAKNASVELSPPVHWSAGPLTLEVVRPAPEEVRSLQAPPPTPGAVAETGPPPPALLGLGDAARTAVMTWFRGLQDVLVSAGKDTDFFHRAARAMVQLLGLDEAAVLVGPVAAPPRKAAWPEGAFSGDAPQPSRSILERVYAERRTLWKLPPETERSASVVGVEAVVAAPILDPAGAVTGVLYGDRRSGAGDRAVITEAEAQLVEVLACGVAAGLARMSQAEAAEKARVLFEQFFTPELAEELRRQPDLLQGRECDVSVLFCDIRSFSRHSERLGPKNTFGWINDVMQALSECVRAEEGVLVDYIGDELVAMWGAPQRQPDHAERACRAALAMLDPARCPLADLYRRWEIEAGAGPLVGIGISSGAAQVGNAGSRLKWKYSPLGPTVNLASRVQGATKHFQTPFLVTGATRRHLGSAFAARRLRKVRVVNIQEPVDLYEVRAAPDAAFETFAHDYEAALAAFEEKDFAAAAQRLGELLRRDRDRNRDAASLLLLSRAAECLAAGSAPDHPVWELPGK